LEINQEEFVINYCCGMSTLLILPNKLELFHSNFFKKENTTDKIDSLVTESQFSGMSGLNPHFLA
jgi:hypothetical protein